MGCYGGGYGSSSGGYSVMPSTGGYYYGADGTLYYYSAPSSYQGAAPAPGAVIEERGRTGDIPAPKPAERNSDDKRPAGSDRPLKEGSERISPPPASGGAKSPDRQP